MHRSEPLLPFIVDRTSYESMRPRSDLWRLTMQVICQRHGLPADGLVRFGDGSDPAFGTNMVFAVGEDHVIKLFPPYWQRLFDAERTVAAQVFGKIGLATPEIYAHGLLDGWSYLVMSRLRGVALAEIWNTLAQADQLRIIAELAPALARLHALPTEELLVLEANWPAWVTAQMVACDQRHREQGVTEEWLQQIPSYLARAAPLYPAGFKPAIVSGDIHQYHLFAKQEQGRWQLSGLFDFDDARIGFHEYDLAAAGLFMMAGRPGLLRPFLLAYGYADADVNEQLCYRLMAYTLLHHYRPFNWVRKEFARGRCLTLEELARAIYALE